MTDKKIEITCLNTGIKKQYNAGISIEEIARDQNVKLKMPILGARVNNQIKELSYSVFKPKIIEFFDFSNAEGRRMYERSLSFILIKAMADIKPELKVVIDHSISQGLYCELVSKDGKYFKPEPEFVIEVAERMQQIVKADIPFTRKEILSTQAAQIYEELGFPERVQLFKNRARIFSSMYFLDNMCDYFYGYLVPSTRYISVSDLIPYYEGMLLRFPVSAEKFELTPVIEQSGLFEIFREHKQWSKLSGISYVSSLNKLAEEGISGELIKISEALQEKKVAEIAEKIKSRGNVKLVLIAGPSSSGKTSFSKRLCVQLRVCGLKPEQISLDNYFVNRQDTPRDENGEYDFESVEAVDYKQFNQDMLDMMAGKTVKMPSFDFKNGQRVYKGNTMTALEDTIFIVEGIHGLNPKMSGMIPAERKFKIYVSALTQVGIDVHNRIPTTDNRLIRRIIRDFQYRHYSAEETLKRWPGVRRGEEKNIFPFQEQADVMFNTALHYELGVLKKYVEPVLQEVNETSRMFGEAHRLLKFLSYFKPMPDNEIPPTSILREFLSGSAFVDVY